MTALSDVRSLCLLALFLGAQAASAFQASFLWGSQFASKGFSQRHAELLPSSHVQSPMVLGLRCSSGTEPDAFHRRAFLSTAAAIFASSPTLVIAAETKTVRAPSPAVALDMLIVMKTAKNLRELEKKVNAEDYKAVKGFVTNPWSSSTAKFLRKNKVLESLALSTKGVGVGTLEADPAFSSEASPESAKVVDLAATFYAAADELAAACESKSKDAVTTSYKSAVDALDVYLAEVKLPGVAVADPNLIASP